MAKVSDSQISCLADMKDGDVAEILIAAPISAVCFSNKVKILSKGTLIKL